VNDATDKTSSGAKPVLDYGHRGLNPHDVRTSRLAIFSLLISLAGTPPFLNLMIAWSLRRWLLRVGVQRYGTERIVFGCVMTPTFVALILATCAAWRIGCNDRLRGEALAMIVMSICVFWLFGGACFFMFGLYEG